MSAIILTDEQSQQYEEGGWSSLRLTETLVEDIERRHLPRPVTVTLDTGEILFTIEE